MIGGTEVVALDGASVVYDGVVPVTAVSAATVSIAAGDYVAIQGRSGSGKSTLLNLLGLLARPTQGHVRFDGTDLDELGPARLAAIRGTRIGFVFQSFHLVPGRDLLDQVGIPLMYQRVRPGERRDRAAAALAAVGLAARVAHRPAELSGGEQQRVAIARALVNEPSLILADEPTGSLDRATADEILDVVDALHRSGRTIVVVTHDPAVAERADRRVRMNDGMLTEVGTP